MADRADDFNRSDNASSLGTPSDAGSAWVAYSGTWGIETNRGYKAASALTNEAAALECSASAGAVEATVAVLGNCGLIGRVSNDSNYILAQVLSGSQVALWKKVSGTFTQLGTTLNTTVPAGARVKLEITAANAITMYVDGVSRRTATDAALSANTKWGLYSRDGSPRFDDFAFTDAAGGAVPVGLATETDTALGLSGVHIRATGLATEADTALSLAARQIRAAGLSTETDTALARTATHIRAAGIATETDTALALLPVAEPGTVGLAVETDQALALQARQIRAAGLAVETDTALALSPGSGALVGMALEIDTAFALQAIQRRSVGLAVESNTALALPPLGATPVDSLARFTISAQARRLSIAATARRLEIGR